MRLVRLLLVGSFLVLSASRGLAQVSCADPDNLCTGDPCTITTLAVQSPCTVNFGARHLIIAGNIAVPNGGTLSWTAAKIWLLGQIDGRHVGNSVGDGADVTLTSNVAEVDLRGEIDVTGTASNGSITIYAGTDLFVKDPLNAKTSGANVTATGGVIALQAGATIVTDQSAVIDVRGADTTAAGSVGMQAAGAINIAGRVFAEGAPGGIIDIESTGGAVLLEKDLRVGSEQGPPPARSSWPAPAM